MKKSLLCCLFLLVANLMMADGVVVVDGMKFVVDTETNQVSLTSVESGVDSLFIPEKIMFEGKEYAVTTLVNRDWSGIHFVEVPSSVKSFLIGCFSYEEDLVGVKFSSSLASLGYGFFEGCRNLRDVELPSSLITLGSRCFRDCSSLESLDIPASVTSLGESCFYGCANLKNLYVGNGVQMLCTIVESCDKFENLYIGNGLRRIEYVSFLNCNSLKMICTTSSQIGYVREKCGIPATLAMLCVPDKEMYAGILGAYNLKNIVTDVPGEAVYTGKGVDVDVLTSVPGCGVSLVSDAETKLPVNVGRYNAPLPVEISSGKWKSTFNTNCSFTIKPAPLTVIANSETREYGQDNPEWSCTYVGFVNNETEDVLTARPTVLCPATKESPVGQYQLIPSAASAKNYEITYERGVLNVTKASQQITWEQDIAKFHVGDIVELQAESSAGLKVKFASSNSSVADVYSSGGKTYMECMAPGTARITASQPGGENYNAADDLVKRVSVEIADGVAGVHAEEDIVEYYSMDGTLVASPTKGIYIVRYKDGQMRKVVLK